MHRQLLCALSGPAPADSVRSGKRPLHHDLKNHGGDGDDLQQKRMKLGPNIAVSEAKEQCPTFCLTPYHLVPKIVASFPTAWKRVLVAPSASTTSASSTNASTIC